MPQAPMQRAVSSESLLSTLLWCQGMQDSGGSFLPPGHQVRGVQALPPEQGTDAPGRLFGLIGLGQDPLLVLRREDPALGNGDDLRVGAVSDPSLAAGRAAFVLASLGLTALYGQGRRECLPVLHAEFPSRPAL